jgi:acyl carrier protein
MTDLLALVIATLREVCPEAPPGLDAATRLAAVSGLDSLRLLETVALAEERLGTQIDTARLERLRTLGDIADALAEAAAR